MRVVLDTNSLLVSIPRKSKYRIIFDAIFDGNITLLVSNDILSEYMETIKQKTNSIVSSNICDFLIQCKNVEQIDTFFRWNLIERDVDDDKFVDCAVSGQADYIVTDEMHFNSLLAVKFPLVKIIRTPEFRDLVKDKKLY